LRRRKYCQLLKNSHITQKFDVTVSAHQKVIVQPHKLFFLLEMRGKAQRESPVLVVLAQPGEYDSMIR